MDQDISRRKFLRIFPPISIAFISIGGMITGCESEETNQNEQQANTHSDSDDPCNDLSDLSQTEIARRKTYGYVTESPYPENLCSNCRLYTPPHSGGECGGCILFEGPVTPNGYCNHWEPVS